MDIQSALLGFAIAATLMTLTPGIDTALVLRTAALENAHAAILAAAGIVTGVLVWGLAVSLGLGAVLAVSRIAYRTLELAGAGYLVWLGARMLIAATRGRHAGAGAAPSGAERGQTALDTRGARRWFVRGLLTNLLNPKVGVFYISFLPQFMPAGVNVIAFSAVLASMHALLSLAWLALLAVATKPFARVLTRPATARVLDSLTGTVLVGFGLRLALAPHGR